MHSTSTTPAAAAGLNAHFDTRTAAFELADLLRSDLAGACDLLLLFASYHHRAAFDDAAEILRRQLDPGALLGITAESVIGGSVELEGRAGLAALALRLPGASIRPFRLGAHEAGTSVGQPELFRQYLRVGEVSSERGPTSVCMLADPFTTPTARLLPMLGGGADRARVQTFGALASGASQPGHNTVILDGASYMDGAVGASISGVHLDMVVSQGCRPVGPTFVITRARGNAIFELGGRRAVEVVQETASGLDEATRTLLGRGLFVGMAVNEYKPRFGRGDFLVRGILGVDARTGAIMVNDLPRVGQTMQFQVRDAQTAEEDLQLLLDAEQFRERPFAALLFSCAGRGSRLFGRPGNDAGTIQRRLGPLPLAGFFGAGEIAPLGEGSYLHGHTACAALFRGGTGDGDHAVETG